MKKLLPSASLLLLSALAVSFLRTSPPAQAAQASPAPQGVEARLALLEEELATLKRQNEETHALLEKTVVYLEKQSKAAQTLLTALDEAEKQGFAVGENWRSRQTLLAGLRSYWSGAEAGLPKVAAPTKAVRAAQK